jgi:hypothetical protein
MVVAIVFCVAVWCAGFGTLRALGLSKGPLGFGLAPSVGLAVLAIVSTWAGLFRLPPPLPGLLVGAIALIGLGVAATDYPTSARALRNMTREQPRALLLLCAGILVPIVAMGVAFANVQAPLSPDDGAFHVETTNAFRQGIAVLGWYPPGLAATFGATLQLLPWIDTAYGAYGLGLGLALMAPIAMFGLAAAVWRNMLAAGAAALLAAFTYLFPYYPQVWSGWPQMVGVLLVIGLWSVAVAYFEQPGWQAALLAGLLVGAIIVVHGTELYSSAIVLMAIVAMNWWRLPWRRLRLEIPGALLLALVGAMPYLPVLFHWAGAGGAFEVGFEDATALAIGAKSTTAAEFLGAYTLDALGIDLPVRVVLIALGAGAAIRRWSHRRRSGSMRPLVECGLFPLSAVLVGLVFYGLALASSFFNSVPLVAQVFSITYPWSLPFRLVLFATIPALLLASGGCVVAFRLWSSALNRVRNRVAHRLAMRMGRLLVVTWALLSCVLMISFLSVPATMLSSFSSMDDGAAMAWLRTHASDSDVVVNDGFDDAGIWTPYKAGVQILAHRGWNDPSTSAMRDLIVRNIGRLEDNPEAMAAACQFGATYVYYGAKNSAWQTRSFPRLEDMLSSSALQLVIDSGKAIVFKVNLKNC